MTTYNNTKKVVFHKDNKGKVTNIYYTFINENILQQEITDLNSRKQSRLWNNDPVKETGSYGYRIVTK